MIGTDEMSSTTGMDISESFRPEDLSKTDFFDFVTASEMGIGVGIGSVGVSLQSQHHQHQFQTQSHQQSQNHERLSTNSNMTHDGGGTTTRSANDGRSNNIISNGNTSDPTLQGYEFWHTDKDTSRLESSIFEDLDRYCWQQQPITAAQTSTQVHHTPATTHNSGSTASTVNCDSTATVLAANNNVSNNHTQSHNATNTTSSSISQTSSNASSTMNTTTIDNGDGQIYTITVLNGGGGGGNESTTGTATSNTAATSSWLKREPDTQIPTSLDLDSLLGNFSGYIKSEYPYDDSGFSTDGTKDVVNGNDANGISIQQQQQQHQVTPTLHGMPSGIQTLPSLVTAMSSSGRSAVNIGQQLVAQFQNNNNDWHMMDHNAAEQNSAESLLRSALQGKGYTKGLHHHMQNGGITLLPTSPTVKDDEMRRILFSSDADSLAFADSTLNTAQIFEESHHHTHMLHLQNATGTCTTPNGPLSQSTHPGGGGGGGGSNSLMVDDMFLTLENAFSEDFDKIKRIANEVQQYCNTPPVENDYIGSEIMMQISPTTGNPTSITQQQQLQPLNSPVATTSTTLNTIGTQQATPLSATHHLQQQQQQPQQQQHKAEVTTSTAATASTTNNSRSKATKKYKRPTSAGQQQQGSSNASNNNNNNSNALNHNTSNSSSNNTITKASNISNNNAAAISSAGSSSSSSNSPPTAHCNGQQRKERSLHYCSICSKGFKDKYSVNVHIRTHTGEKPFACSLCGKSFRQKAHLAKHYQTHMAQKNNHGAGGSSGSNGGLVKSNSAKHHRTSAIATAATAGNTVAVAAQQQQRQLTNMLSSSTLPMSSNNSNSSSNLNVGVGVSPTLLGVTSAVVTLNGPTSTTGMSSNLLTPPNGLLTNR